MDSNTSSSSIEHFWLSQSYGIHDKALLILTSPYLHHDHHHSPASVVGAQLSEEVRAVVHWKEAGGEVIGLSAQCPASRDCRAEQQLHHRKTPLGSSCQSEASGPRPSQIFTLYPEIIDGGGVNIWTAVIAHIFWQNWCVTFLFKEGIRKWWGDNTPSPGGLMLCQIIALVIQAHICFALLCMGTSCHSLGFSSDSTSGLKWEILPVPPGVLPLIQATTSPFGSGGKKNIFNSTIWCDCHEELTHCRLWRHLGGQATPSP